MGSIKIGKGNEQFLLSIALLAAKNLNLIRFAPKDPSTSKAFYFYYQFHSIDVATEIFDNLTHPNFPEERQSFRLKGSSQDLESFLQQNQKLHVFLCSDRDIVASASANLTLLNSARQVDLELTLQTVSQKFNEKDPHRPVVSVRFALESEQFDTHSIGSSSQRESKKESKEKETTRQKRESLEKVHQFQAPSQFPAHPNPVATVPTPGADGIDWKDIFRESEEYKAALELEVWKREEEIKYQQEIANREAEMNLLFSRRFRKQKSEWEQEMKGKLEEIERIQTQVNQALHSLQEREKKLEEEQENLKLEDYKREFELELKRVTNQLEVEARKNEELASVNENLRGELKQAHDRERELQARIDELQREKEENASLKEELQATMRSKQYYKTEWMKALKDLAKYKKEALVRPSLGSDTDTLQGNFAFGSHSHLPSVFSPGQALPRSNSSTSSIASDLSSTGKFVPLRPSAFGNGSAFDLPNDSELEKQIEQLTKKRREMLSSGNYSQGDKAIKEIEKLINNLTSGFDDGAPFS